MIIGHRGSRFDGLPENSLSSFKDAVNSGVDVVELDIWLSYDEKVVVHHDETFGRMTNGYCNAKITETSYDQYPLIVNDQEVNLRNQMYTPNEIEKIPLLTDVFDAIPRSIVVNIEFKQNSDLLIQKVLTILNEKKIDKKHGLYWFSLNEDINKKLRRACPEIPTIISIKSMLRILLLHYLGVLPFFPVVEQVFCIKFDEVTIEDIREEKAFRNLPAFMHQVLAYLFAGRPPTVMFSPSLFSHLRRRGLEIWFMGVDQEADIKIAMESGATGILVNRPRWAVSVVDMINNAKYDYSGNFR